MEDFYQYSVFDIFSEPFKIDKPIRLIELFSGIGSQAKALERIGADFEHYRVCEFDKYAIKSYNAIHNTNFATSDITELKGADLGIVDTDKYCYIMTYSFPCQDLSLAGKQKGMAKGENTRSGLLWEVERLLNECEQLPQVLLMENVTQVHGTGNVEHFAKWIEFLESKGYSNYWKDLNAKNFGIPQNRDRCFMVSLLGDYRYEFPREFPLQLRLKDMLEDSVEEKYYLSERTLNFFLENTKKQEEKGNGFKFETTDGDTIAKSITTRAGSRMDDNFIEDPLPFDYRYDEGVRVREDGCMPTLNASHTGTTSMSGQGFIFEPLALDEQNGYIRTDGTVGTLTTDGSSPKHNNRVIEPVGKRKDIKEIDRCCEYCGAKLVRKRFNGRLEDFTVFSKRKYCNRECMRKGFLKVGENNQTWSSAHSTARKINELILHKDFCEICGSTQNLDIHHIDGNWQNNNLDNLMCLCRSCHTKYERNKDKVELRIRKLTPRETWRLMGFDDADFEKASQHNSNSQLYKQAGNSIVVDVLAHIFTNMF